MGSAKAYMMQEQVI